MNSLDGMDEQRRQADLPLQIQALAGLGLEARELDLRQHTPDTIGGAMPWTFSLDGAPDQLLGSPEQLRALLSHVPKRRGGELFTQVAREGNV